MIGEWPPVPTDFIFYAVVELELTRAQFLDLATKFFEKKGLHTVDDVFEGIRIGHLANRRVIRGGKRLIFIDLQQR